MDEQEKLKLIKEKEIRVRYSPAPTGPFHLGSARTALFNYLFAKKHGGTFVLRIEDTDKIRSKKEYEQDIISALKWLNIEWDEGPDVGGPYGPYRQSERKKIYEKYIKKLLKEEKAYYCFCDPSQLKKEREYQILKGLVPKYSGKCAYLSKEKIKQYQKERKSSVIRLRVPQNKKIEFEDRVRGHISFNSSLIGDFVIAKDFQTPLYNFACAIDDYEMKISHVIRGEDILPNTPKQIIIQKILKFNTPQYAHIPLIFGQDRTKLSKRHNAKSILEYKQEGYLAEAIINFVALLGWNPGDDREIFSLTALIREFSLQRVQKSPAIFNPSKLDFLNGFYIRHKNPEEITQLCIPYLIKKKLIRKTQEDEGAVFGKDFLGYIVENSKKEITFDDIKKMILLYQERLKKLSEIPDLIDFFFKEKLDFDKNLLKWKDMTEADVKNALNYLIKILSQIPQEKWNRQDLSEILLKEAQIFAKNLSKKEGDRGYLLWPLRVALTGKEKSAPPFEIAEILGKEETIKRIKHLL